MTIETTLNKLIIKIKTSNFIKNITIVMSGTVFAQALGFALSPVISRLYSPSDFGQFGSFSSFLGIITAAVTLEYSQAIILPKKNGEAFNLFILSCICTLSISCIFVIVYFIAPWYFNKLLQANSIWVLIPLIAAIIISGLNQTFQAWCVRAKLFKHTSASQVIRSLTANSVQTGFGFIHYGAPVLIWSSVVADFFATMNLALAAFRNFKQLVAGFSIHSIFRLAKEYRDFPAYSASINVINALSLGIPVFLLTHFYSVAVAGGYAFAMRIISIPMEFVLRALRQVLYQKAAETYNEGRKLTPLYVKITGGLFLLAVLPSLVFFIWAPQIFGFVFGTKWISSGEFARGLIVWLMVMFCNLPATLFARIIRVQRKMFIYNIALLLFRTAALVLGGKYLSPASTILVFALVGAAMNVIFIVIIGVLLAEKERASGMDRFMEAIKESPR